MSRVRVPPRSAAAVRLEAGVEFAVIAPEGRQVADLTLVGADGARFDASDTLDLTTQVWPTAGDRLYDTRGRPLGTLVADDRGTNDLLFPPCSGPRLTAPTFDPEPAGCRELLARALSRAGASVEPAAVSTLNCFMATSVDDDGAVSVQPSPARPGDALTVRTARPVYVGVSACPALNEESGINGDAPGPVALGLPASPAVARADVDEFET